MTLDGDPNSKLSQIKAELSHRLKWRAQQREFDVRNRTAHELVRFPEQPAHIPGALEHMVMPWLYVNSSDLMLARMGSHLSLALGEVDVHEEVLQAYLEREKLITLTPDPRPLNITDLIVRKDRGINIHSIIDATTPAYFNMGMYNKNWLLQFALDRDKMVRNIKVLKVSRI